MIFSKELEKLAEEEYPPLYIQSSVDENLGKRIAYIQGAAALENLIMKSGGEAFNEDIFWDDYTHDVEHWDYFVKGAYAQFQRDQLIIGGLRTSLAEKDRVNEMLKIEIDEQLDEIQKLELLKEDHAWMCNFAEDVIKEKHKAWLKYNELKDKHEPEIVSADIENFKLNIKTERLRCIKENIAKDFYPVNKIAIGGSDIKWLMKQYEQLEEENAALKEDLEQVQDSHKRQCDLNDRAWKKNEKLEAEVAELKNEIETLNLKLLDDDKDWER